VGDAANGLTTHVRGVTIELTDAEPTALLKELNAIIDTIASLFAIIFMLTRPRAD
jgi:hypothetical protein